MVKQAALDSLAVLAQVASSIENSIRHTSLSEVIVTIVRQFDADGAAN